MEFDNLVSTIALPLSILTAGTCVYVAIAFATEEARRETIAVLNSKDFGSSWFEKLARAWSLQFRWFFGSKLLSKRQLITIPVYTVVVSALFFTIWLVHVYIIQDGLTLPLAPLPISMREAVAVFYPKGLIAAILIDFITIQITKKCVDVGLARGYRSFRFVLYFASALMISCFIYTLITLLFRVEDMVRIYMEVAPNDPMPLVPYEPIERLLSSLRLFQPETVIYVTSQGWIGTYFMPEPVIFYCLVTGHLSLIIIMLAYSVMAALAGFKEICIGTVRNVGTPQTNANSVILLVGLGLASILVMAISFLALA